MQSNTIKHIVLAVFNTQQFFGHGYPEQSGRWYSEDKWVLGIVFMAMFMGYVIIRVQVEGVKGYNEDQVALFIPDSTAFGTRVPVTLGMPTINQIVNVIKGSEIDELSVLLNGLRIATYWLDVKQNSPSRTTQPPDLSLIPLI